MVSLKTVMAALITFPLSSETQELHKNAFLIVHLLVVLKPQLKCNLCFHCSVHFPPSKRHAKRFANSFLLFFITVFFYKLCNITCNLLFQCYLKLQGKASVSKAHFKENHSGQDAHLHTKVTQIVLRDFFQRHCNIFFTIHL